jgi:A/G-specific adenine glycosylase
MSVRERARIMSFPDSFQFVGGIVMGRVLTGQAVPPLLAEAVARAIRRGLMASRFRGGLMTWFRTSQRDYPWRRQDATPFEVLLAEMLLRKTRADAVVPVWRRLLERYPDPDSLARARVEDVRRCLHELGLSQIRAKAIVRVADLIVRRHMGIVPSQFRQLGDLPEVGPYIANATLCFGFGRRRPILDANVHRVYVRLFDLPPAKELHKARAHWDLAEHLLPERGFREYNLALLDFGAQVCTARSPRCTECFAAEYCSYYERRRPATARLSRPKTP